MIDLNDKYCLLNNGNVEFIHFVDGSLREIEEDTMTGMLYLVHDIIDDETNKVIKKNVRNRILCTSNHLDFGEIK